MVVFISGVYKPWYTSNTTLQVEFGHILYYGIYGTV